MCTHTIKCRFNHHDWKVESYKIDDNTRFPAFRICQNCGKFEQPGVSTIVVDWISSEDSVDLSVVKSKVFYEQKLISKNHKNEETKKDW
jgi:glucose-6-phosphate-specific signal transduction histidine kinase